MFVFLHNDVYKIQKEHDYQPRWTEKKCIEWAENDLQPIIDLKQKISNKLVLSQEEYTEIATMAQAVKEGEYTKPILEELPGEHQVALYTDELKVLIDYFQICHDTKVLRVIDYKTTHEYLERFIRQITKYGLDIQLSFYSYVASQLYPDYKVLEPILIVVSKKEPEYAEPFTLSKQVIENARLGWTDKYGNNRKGWEELLNEAKTYNGEMYNLELIKNKTNYISEL